MKRASSHSPSEPKASASTTAAARLMACICERDFMSPCIICPPSSGKIGSRFSRVHQQLTSIRKKNSATTNGEHPGNSTAGMTPRAEYTAIRLPMVKSPTYRQSSPYASTPTSREERGPAAVITTPCMRVSRAVSFVQSPPSQARYTQGKPPPSLRPTRACPISCASRTTKADTMKSSDNMSSRALVAKNARPSMARVSQSVG